MATNHATGKSLRIGADELRNRLANGEAATLIDVRAQKAWDASNETMQGAIRVAPDDFQADPSWPKDRLTVLYCT